MAKTSDRAALDEWYAVETAADDHRSARAHAVARAGHRDRAPARRADRRLRSRHSGVASDAPLPCAGALRLRLDDARASEQGHLRHRGSRGDRSPLCALRLGEDAGIRPSRRRELSSTWRIFRSSTRTSSALNRIPKCRLSQARSAAMSTRSGRPTAPSSSRALQPPKARAPSCS